MLLSCPVLGRKFQVLVLRNQSHDDCRHGSLHVTWQLSPVCDMAYFASMWHGIFCQHMTWDLLPAYEMASLWRDEVWQSNSARRSLHPRQRFRFVAHVLVVPLVFYWRYLCLAHCFTFIYLLIYECICWQRLGRLGMNDAPFFFQLCLNGPGTKRADLAKRSCDSR